MSGHSFGLPPGEPRVTSNESSYLNYPYQREVENVLKWSSDFITEREKKIIRDMYSENRSKNVIQIINNFGESICSGKNPSNSLLNDICLEVVKELGNNYIWFVKSVLVNLPDRNKIRYYL